MGDRYHGIDIYIYILYLNDYHKIRFLAQYVKTFHGFIFNRIFII
jgi:hypothetical protein